MPEKKPLVLLIDAYDSFSNNIVSLLETTLNASVRTVKIDNVFLASDEALRKELKYYTAVVCGPGPGHPINKADIGIIQRIWNLSNEELLPVLGICLGLQSLCTSFGGTVKNLKGPQHGIIRSVTHVGELEEGQGSIFDGVGEIHATLYQSLHADIGHKFKSGTISDSQRWNSTDQCPDLIPLAWAEWNGNEDNDSGMRDENILLAVRHRSKPFWALQYHPESICTNAESRKVIENWFFAAEGWNRETRKTKIEPQILTDEIFGQAVIRESLLSYSQTSTVVPAKIPQGLLGEDQSLREVFNLHLDEIYHCHTAKLPDICSTPDILEFIQGPDEDHIILDSSNSHEISAQVRGRYSIIALDVKDALRIDYAVERGIVEEKFHASFVSSHGGYKNRPLNQQSCGGVWPFLAGFLESRRISEGNPESPFWGGFMGYTSYEMGLKGIEVKPKPKKSQKGLDLCLVWVTKSLVLDHEKGLVYIQEVTKERSKEPMSTWMKTVVKGLDALSRREVMTTLGVIKPFLETSQKDSEAQFTSPTEITNPNDLPLLLPRLPSSTKGTKPAPLNAAVTLLTKWMDPADGQKRYEGEIPHVSSSSSSPYQPQCSTSSSSLSSTGPSSRSSLDSNHEPTSQRSKTEITSPVNEQYESKVRLAQKYIRQGDSYELCLTDQTTIQRHWSDGSSEKKHLGSNPNLLQSSRGSAWSLYRTLRTQQPAPFASCIRLGQTTLISASPERFLFWTSDGHCELRPMKGTVRKSSTVTTLSQARALLNVPKEKAENLMIVDLVRHDLHGICGSGNVSVPRLMVVEEYKSVFQMISIVQGHIQQGNVLRRHTGIDVLAASLPPGSMTGAPKKRSCEILQEIEDTPRGLYSGVVGYMDIGGRGDWSVTIRSMFRYDEDDVKEDGRVVETWRVGAGGAVTALSTPEGEREEMRTKLDGTLGVFA